MVALRFKLLLFLLALRDIWMIPVFRDYNEKTNRLEFVYGNYIQRGKSVYIIYYRLWFKPFEVRDPLMFDSFIDDVI